jgi:PAS domain S-box-containing protein
MEPQNVLQVILVDDSEIIRTRLASALGAVNGIGAILEAGNAESGRQLLEANPADIVILDVDLAGKNGMDLLSAVNRQGAKPMVIMLSNYDHPKLRERCLELGADFYCHKATGFEKIIELSQSLIYDGRIPSHLPTPSNADLLKAARLFRDREERYRALYDRSLDCLFVLDLQGRLMDANPAGLALLGYAVEEIPTLTIASLLDASDVLRAQDAIAQVVQTGTLHDTLEFDLRRKDGRKVTMEVKASLIVRDGKPYASPGISRDISGRKQAEAEILRLNRLYAVLSHVNQTLIRAVTKEELFRQVCKIAVENAGFQAVVIAWLDPETKAVLPVAHAGGPESALQNIKVFADSRPEGHGPTGTAVREGKPCVINDVLADPRTALWHDQSREAGVHSAGSFPIRVGGAVRGTLSLYANEVNVFREKEIALLSTVAENISSALDGFEETKRKQKAEALLKSSQESNGVVLHETGQAVFDCNLASGVISWNGASREVLGHILEDTQPLTVSVWRQSVHPDDRDKLARTVDRAIKQRHRYQIEYRVRCKDGVYEFVEERGSFFADAVSETHRLLGTISNISERKAFEEHLREQARLLDLAHDAILVLDLNDNILYWNSGAQRMYGWTAEQALGRKAEELLRPDAAITVEARRRVMERDEWSGEITHLTKDGVNVLAESRLTLVRDRQGNPKSILSINTDITERKKLETQFLRAQRIESIGILASGIAHDLNNVFAPIIMAGELLESNAPENNPSQLHRLIQSSAHRGAELVQQICAFCRGVDGRRSRIQVGPIIRDLQHILTETLPKSIRIQVDVPKGLWAVVADPTQIYQVLLNLCVNARDAMAAGGALTISVENTLRQAHSGFSAQDRGDSSHYLRLVVSDTGTGIPENIREKIFDPFFTTKEPGKGTGLGLSTTMGIIKSHGGFINLYSEPGKGTSFNIYLPAQGESNTSVLTMREAELPRGNGELVLVVDDENSIRAVATQTLQAFGYRVICAKDGAEALDLYSRQADEIAAVLVDVMMPVMDGMAAIQALSTFNAGIKIIAASGLSPEAHGIKVSQGPVKAFLHKPYSSQSLLTTLHHLFKKETEALSSK